MKIIFVAIFLFSCETFENSTPSIVSSEGENFSLAPSVAPSGYKDVQFGLALQYDNGAVTDVAVDKYERVIEVHKSQTYNTLWYRTGNIRENTISWTGSKQYDNGKEPSVAMNDKAVVIEVHRTNNFFYPNDLYYHVGILNGSSVSWGSSRKYDTGSTPSVAVNNNNIAVEVHRGSGSSNRLYYRVGKVNSSNKTISWGSSVLYDTGESPSVAIDDNGLAIEVHDGSGTLYYRVGKVNEGSKRIDWGPSRAYTTGSLPSVSLTAGGMAVEVHKASSIDKLYSMAGKVNEGGRTIAFSASQYFDKGDNPSVAAKENYAIQTHDASELATGLWASSSLITDHANWMYNMMGTIGHKTLGEIVMPGSHDAGMYPTSLGQTQDHNLYQQLTGGVRYFDLRPGSDGNIHHGIITGPPVDEVLNDVRKYMAEGHQELVILKFSHYDEFNDNAYVELVNKIQNKLGSYLFRNENNARLGEISLSGFLKGGGKVLILCSGNYPINNAAEGIYTYRDWNNGDAYKGDLVVFDRYSNTTDYGTMRNDQLNKFNAYNGIAADGNTPSDMFLLSWTLTPITDVWSYSTEPNRVLSHEMKNIQANGSGKIPNILYVDYYQYARVTDACILMNERF
ncbi:hypothetical protein [Xanthovirga aplysinae]|uniref:hypothetical protein n=1 Tax=Xanthovirga aplysinae TaxID=2529853 RepID=UPI0012BB894D|nr:hypothetical protein [Xanthovirga aplysinae]MTI32099.1 hypothetical protein [Xanthovirga aplysinae]